MTATDDVRRWAMALPEVEETSHFRFHVPIWKVRGKTFLGMGKEETTAVFCVSEQEAGEAAAADPRHLCGRPAARMRGVASSDCRPNSAASPLSASGIWPRRPGAIRRRSGWPPSMTGVAQRRVAGGERVPERRVDGGTETLLQHPVQAPLGQQPVIMHELCPSQNRCRPSADTGSDPVSADGVRLSSRQHGEVEAATLAFVMSTDTGPAPLLRTWSCGALPVCPVGALPGMVSVQVSLW